MKILYTHYITQADHPAVQMVNHVARELRGLGHEVLIHASAGQESHSDVDRSAKTVPGKSQDSSFKESLKSRLKRTLWFAKAMYRNRAQLPGDLAAMRNFSPDIVLARQDAYCWSVVKAARQLRVPVVTYADAPVAYELRMFNAQRRWHPPGLVEYIERWGIRASEAVVTISRPAAKQLASYPTDTPIFVDHNGIDENRFPEFTDEQRLEVRNSLGLKGRTVIGFQGSFRAFHGIDRLGELIKQTRELDVDWLLIGDGPERAGLEAAMKNHQNVRFLGRRKQEEMGRLLAALDIAVAPHAKMDGDFYFCPLKILEYAASGCAGLASNQGDIPLLLANGAGGEIIDSDDSADWLCGILRLISDPGYRKRLGKVARQHVLQNLTWRRTADSVASILMSVLAHSATMPIAEEELSSQAGLADGVAPERFEATDIAPEEQYATSCER